MGIRHRWTLICFLLHLSAASCVYPEYSIEESCLLGNETLIYDTSKIGSVGILKATFHPSYSSHKECTIVLLPSLNQEIVLSIQKVNLYYQLSTCEDYIKVFHSDVFASPTTLCSVSFSVEEKLSFYSKGPMTIVYHVHSHDKRTVNNEEGFTLTYTVVSKDMTVCLQDDVFICDNGKCIHKDKKCDGHNNCGDRSDESSLLCDPINTTVLQAIDATYVIVSSIFIFFIIIGCAVLVSRRKRMVPDDTETSSISEHDEPTAMLTPYQAIYPSGLSICRNPAGPEIFFYHQTKTITMESGFSSPCHSSGLL